jgi:hypothetical protein
MAALVIAVVALLPQFQTVTFTDVGREDTGIPARYQQPPDGKELTGNLTVYLLRVDVQKHESQDVIDIVLGVIGYVDAGHYSNFGASPRGQYTNAGETPKPAETVKFYIDSDVKKPDGSSISRTDLIEYYSFGNGITCCGFTLRDGTDVAAVIIVTDWAYDEYMMEKLDQLKGEMG